MSHDAAPRDSVSGVDVSTIQVLLKPGVRDVRGESVRQQARKLLGIDTGEVRSSMVFSVLYALKPEQLQLFANKGLRDEVIEEAYVNRLWQDARFKSYLLIARLPGVTDDEGVSAQKTLCDLLNLEFDTAQQHIFTQTLYLFEKEIAPESLRRLGEEVLGNPLVNHFEYGLFTGELRYVPEVRIVADATTEVLDLEVSDEALLALSKAKVLSLNLEEMQAVRDYYRREDVRTQRKALGLPMQPTDCELEVFAQTWSEHCKHKEFTARIQYTDAATGETKVIDSLFKTYIRKATDLIGQELKDGGARWLVKVFTDNAGVVRVDDERVFVFKVETHNSPSALDPYGGAITGILGNNRDPLGTGKGGGRLLFNTNVLCFGPPDYKKPLLTGQLHPARVFSGVREGIEHGGNKSGVPTVNGAVLFDDRFAGKPLVYCGTGSIMPAFYGDKNTWDKDIQPTDCILMAGGRVGKDGIHGATFSSVEIDKHSPRSAVQIGSPITQKLLSDFLEEATAKGWVTCTTDNGAGGLSSSVGELASISGGARVLLDKVPLKYSGLRPWEIFVSESQERMTLVVPQEHLEKVMDLAKAREVEISHIGEFTNNGTLEVRYQDQIVASLDIEFLHEGVPRKYLEAVWEPPALEEPVGLEVADHGAELLKLLGSFNICSRENVIRQYDHEVKGKTIVKPLMGAMGKAPQDAAVMRVGYDSYKGLAVSNGIAPKYGDIDAYQASACAFDEALRSLVSVGAVLPDTKDPSDRFWCACDNFCVPDSVYDPKGNPDGKYKMAQLVRMCEALFELSTWFKVPMTSGKDSMKNDFRADGVKISVPPTILYSMVAALEDVRKAITSEFKAPGDRIYLLGETFDELGASEFYRLKGLTGKNVPTLRKEEALQLYRLVNQAQAKRLIQSSHDLSDGGLSVALAESCFGSGLGANVKLPCGDLSTLAWLYGESCSRLLVTVTPQRAGELEALFGPRATLLGDVTTDPTLTIHRCKNVLLQLPVSALLQAWDTGLEG